MTKKKEQKTNEEKVLLNEMKSADNLPGEQEPQETGVEMNLQVEQVDLEVLTSLQEELSEMQAKANEYLDGWQRSRAEFANYRKRVEREQAETYQRAASSVVKRFVEVLDDLELALRNRPSEGEGAAWSNGIELIYRKLVSALESEGITAMEALGTAFDPNFHEAISMEPSDKYESGTVIEVIKQGYLQGERVLRPALVRVAA